MRSIAGFVVLSALATCVLALNHISSGFVFLLSPRRSSSIDSTTRPGHVFSPTCNTRQSLRTFWLETSCSLCMQLVVYVESLISTATCSTCSASWHQAVPCCSTRCAFPILHFPPAAFSACWVFTILPQALVSTLYRSQECAHTDCRSSYFSQAQA